MDFKPSKENDELIKKVNNNKKLGWKADTCFLRKNKNC
jgi:hypothetical protein